VERGVLLEDASEEEQLLGAIKESL
jgi:hypothetical protein